jgi:hypothetical protein
LHEYFQWAHGLKATQEGYSGGRGAGGDRVPVYMKIAILAEVHAMLLSLREDRIS